MPNLKFLYSNWVDIAGAAVAPTGDALSDIASGSAIVGQDARALDYLFNPATGGFERHRTMTTIQSASTAATASAAIWTPANGKSFRLMGGVITIPANVATSGGGVVSVTLNDQGTSLNLVFSFFAPSAAGTTVQGNYNIPFTLPGNGKLSAAPNNVLNATLSAAVSAGNVRITVFGNEE